MAATPTGQCMSSYKPERECDGWGTWGDGVCTCDQDYRADQMIAEGRCTDCAECQEQS